MSKQVKLIPPDRKQCQAEKKEGCWPDAEHFMIIGPGKMVRCKNKPLVIIKEKKSKDGQLGSMALCVSCLEVARKQLGKNYFTEKLIKSRA